MNQWEFFFDMDQFLKSSGIDPNKYPTPFNKSGSTFFLKSGALATTGAGLIIPLERSLTSIATGLP